MTPVYHQWLGVSLTLPFFCCIFPIYIWHFPLRHWVGPVAWAPSCLNQQHLAIQGCTPTLRRTVPLSSCFFFLFLYQKRSNSIWDFRCLVTRWLLSSLIGGFGDGSLFFPRSSHKPQSDHTWRRLRSNVYDGEDLLSEASKSVPGWGCRECRIVGNGGNSGPGQPCRTHVWVSRHRARSVCPD